jgi:hypothetical protein
MQSTGNPGPTYASTAIPLTKDGTPYAVASPVPVLEGDVANTAPGNYPVGPDQAALAVVTLTAQGAMSNQTTYIVMQTALSDGTWIDLAWCTWTGTSGSVTFVLSGGAAGANAFQQRVAGVSPAPALGSNQCPLGGQIRFVGKSSQGSSSSSSSAGPAAVTPAVLASIVFKLLGLR